jgi:predicted secreted protein
LVELTSVLAIYVLLWVLCAFIMLPLGIRTHDEAGIEKIPGQADSAPANFRPGKVVLRATILSAILCGLYFANYHFGWITAQDINLYGNGPQADQAVSR